MGARKDYQSTDYRAKRIADFWAKVARSDDATMCWPWQGAIFQETGYGCFNFLGKLRSTHRIAFSIEYGETSEDVLHNCDNRLCCNPSHLFPGTQADNMADMVAKDRQAKGEDHGSVVLTESSVLLIRRLYRQGISGPKLARRYSVNVSTIYRAISGQTWGHL